MARRKEPKIPDAILDQLLGGADPKTAFDPNGLLNDLKKAWERVAALSSAAWVGSGVCGPFDGPS